MYVIVLGGEYGAGSEDKTALYTAGASCLLQMTPAGSGGQGGGALCVMNTPRSAIFVPLLSPAVGG